MTCSLIATAVSSGPLTFSKSHRLPPTSSTSRSATVRSSRRTPSSLNTFSRSTFTTMARVTYSVAPSKLDLLGNGIFNVDGDYWKFQDKLLATSSTTSLCASSSRLSWTLSSPIASYPSSFRQQKPKLSWISKTFFRGSPSIYMQNGFWVQPCLLVALFSTSQVR